MLKGIHLFLFIVFIYLNYFLVLFLCPSFSYKVSPQDEKQIEMKKKKHFKNCPAIVISSADLWFSILVL